jgi:predicted alpha/beta superfamily hydrolase
VIHSRLLKEDRTYQVSLPASYHWALNRRYPVLFVLDGERNFLHTAASAEFLASQGEIPEVIVVGIVSTVRIRDFTQTDWSSHWVGGGGAQHFRSFLSRELIPRIDKDYRTNRFRILAGHSASGQFALYTLTSEPSLFNAYIVVSPSLDWDNELPQRSLEESFGHTDSLRAFLYFAWSDDAGQALEQDLKVVTTLETRSPKGFRWVAKGFPDETHVSISLLAHIDALRRVFVGFRFHNDLLDKGFAYAQRHFQSVSDTVGYPIPVPEEVINNFAYEALAKGDSQEAIVFFKRNVTQNPNSANAYDGLADAYEKAGTWKEAIASSETSIALARKFNDPNLAYFVEHLKKIKKKSTRGPGK